MNKEIFIQELKKLNINVTDTQISMLDTYYNILIEENNKYNLTNITDINQVYLKHFYDSLTIVKAIDLNNQKLCDIGSGAGFPGLVLKILFPNLDITLVEATEKRCNFLKLVTDKLNLSNVTIINKRAEIYSKEVREYFDIVTSRAVAPLKHLLEYSIPLVKVNGYYIAMKGNIDKETTNIDNYYKKLNINKIKEIHFLLPIEESNRTLLLYQKTQKTNSIYPRKYNEIKKKEI
jgi:16S rRNA (guanine527-N7)-methyltransferase